MINNGSHSNIIITYDDQTNAISFTAENGVADSTTDDLVEGDNNLYYTDARARNAVSGGNGISVSPGATCVVSQCFFNVAAGAGYAVEGSLGSVVIHALNAFIPGTNTKLNPAIGAGSIAMATSFT
jgi:hypothetical protein